MKIGLYFGTFNPIHVGHLVIANYMADFTDLDQVWLVVSPQNPLKEKSTLLADFHRLALVKVAIDDNPKLNARDWYGKNPIKIVLDQKNRIPKENYIFDNQSETLLITADKINFDKKVGKQISTLLFENDIQSVIIEGGSRTLQTFLDENLWDEARIFKGPIVFGTGVKAPQYKGTFISKSSIRNDELLIFKNHD